MGDPNKITGLIKTEGTTRVYQMASDALGLRLAGYSPEQVDTLARSAALIASDNAARGAAQGVFLSRDGQTIGIRQAFGISEIGVQDALNRQKEAPEATVASLGAAQQQMPPQREAPPLAAAVR